MSVDARHRIAVVAYSAGNLGDDIFATLVLNRYPNTEFYFFAPDRQALGLAGGERNAYCISDSEFAAAVKSFDALIVLGGSMFQERTGWQRQWGRYAARFCRSRMAGVPVGVIGASFGPVRSPLFRQAYRLLFRKVEWVSVRDELSGSRLGVSRIYPDLAFADPRLTPSPSQSKHVAVQIMDLGDAATNTPYVRGCAALVEELTSIAPVRIFSFQDASQVSDTRIAEAVRGLLSEHARESVELIPYHPVNFSTYWGALQECWAVVGTRFHSMIFALAMQQRLIVIDYHEKIRASLQSLGLEVLTVAPDDVEASVQRIVSALSAPDPVRADQLEAIRESAILHLTWLDQVLSDS